MTSAGSITLWPFIKLADDGDGYIAGFKDDAGRILGTVVPLATDTVLDALRQELGGMRLVPRIMREDGVVSVENDGLDGAEVFESLERIGIFSQTPIDTLVADAMNLLDTDPDIVADLEIFRDRLVRALATVEAKLAERRSLSS